MDDKEKLVKIPSYAKIGKNNMVYAVKKDMPYFGYDQEERGYLSLGKLTEEPGMMKPGLNYYFYCTQEALQKRDRMLAEEEAAIEAEEKRIKEEQEELERNLGWYYYPRNEVKKDLTCKPANGFLAEKFFAETGIGSLLEEVFGKERAFWLRLLAALAGAGKVGTINFEGLDAFPMKDHMIKECTNIFSLRLWGTIKKNEIQTFLSKWIQCKDPKKVSSLDTHCSITLYHDSTSDDWGYCFFCSRVRTGTKYETNYMLYRDADTDQLLAYERYQYDESVERLYDRCDQVYTIKHSLYSRLQNALFRMYMDRDYFLMELAGKQVPLIICMLPSYHACVEEIEGYLSSLANTPLKNGWRIIRWDGECRDLPGHWVLMENEEKRKRLLGQETSILAEKKKKLEAMSFFNTLYDPYRVYFAIDRVDEDDIHPFGDDKFTVELRKNAHAWFEKNAGRLLYFVMEEDIPDEKLIRMQRQDEDQLDLWNTMINHGETADVTKEFFDGMEGRDFTVFLGQMYREWIFDHIEDQLTEEFDINDFFAEIAKIEFVIEEDGKAKPRRQRKKRTAWLERFGVAIDDLKNYMNDNIEEKKYFSEQFEDGYDD